MPDTEVRRTRRGLAVALLALAILVAASRSHPAQPPPPRVLWARADHVYVALPDGGDAQEGDSVAFFDRGKPVASGRVASIVRGEMAVVALTSGSFDRVKKIDRVRVALTRPPFARGSSLRVALPGEGRGYLLFRCSKSATPLPRLPDGLRGYALREGEASERPLRLKPDPHVSPPAPWPDTLVILYFGNATDEEIALERGDVDVAVFWPGELSRRMREDSRWLGSPLGVRDRGILALLGAGEVASASPDSASAAAFNDEMFRGDLEWRGTRSGSSLPARTVLARVAYVDAPSDSLPSRGFQPLFRLRCPVLSAPPARTIVERIGADVFANMPPCGPVAARR